MKTAIQSTLPLLLFAGLASAQTVPPLWDRYAEWLDPSVAAAGTTLGNPAPDSVGNLVWNYEWQDSLVGSGIPMWSQWNFPTAMVADPAYLGGSPAWALGQASTTAAANRSYLIDFYNVSGPHWKPKPFVRWENTSGQSFSVDIVGTMSVLWDGVAGNIQTTAVDVGIVFLDASAGNAKTALYTANVSKPTPASLLPESLSLPPVFVAGVSIDPGDSLLISVSAVTPTGNNYVGLNDNLRFVVGGSVPATETVRLGVPPNPQALLPGVTSGPVLGRTWDPVIEHTTFMPSAVLDLLGVSAVATNISLPSWGTLLCDLTTNFSLASGPAGQPFAIAIPLNGSLVGVAFSTQGASLDALGNMLFTNAIDITIGNS